MQLSAKLHCLFGIPIQYDEVMYPDSDGIIRPYACSQVYDLRNYTDLSLWGPFMNQSTHEVDWEKLEAIMVVIGHNWRKFGRCREFLTCALFYKPFVGAMPNSYVSIALPWPLRQPASSAKIDDPYGITGTWLRIVCFLNYQDLFDYNFEQEVPDDQPRPPLDMDEATRFIIAELRATKVEPPGKSDSQELPVVHFSGLSRSTHGPWDVNAHSSIRGTVRMTKDGYVRWTTFSIYDG